MSRWWWMWWSAMSSVALLYPAVPSESFSIPNPLINYAERIRTFSEMFPESVLSGYSARAHVVSILLCGLDWRLYPVFRQKMFGEAYKAVGYKPPGSEADEAGQYEHCPWISGAIYRKSV